MLINTTPYTLANRATRAHEEKIARAYAMLANNLSDPRARGKNVTKCKN